MSNVCIKIKIRGGSYVVECLQRIRKKKTLVICDKFFAESGAISYILDALDSSNAVDILDQAIPSPTIEVAGKGPSVICKVHPKTVVGFGGGFAIDTARGMIYFVGVRDPVPKPKFITTPTTNGANSEVTSAAVVTDPESKSKHLISSDDILIDVVIFDPGLTLSVPSSITVNTGTDVLIHALEAYVANGSNVFSDALPEKAAELSTKASLQYYRDGKNLETRTSMHEASTLVRVVFDMAGLRLSHGITHQLGDTFYISRGLVSALLLNQITDYDSVSHDIMSEYASLACKVQLVDMNESPVMTVNTLKELIRTLTRCMEMPFSIRELGVDIEVYEEQLQNMMDNAPVDDCLADNPREARTEVTKRILLSIY